MVAGAPRALTTCDMNPKTTGLWLFLAAGLFAFIFFFQRHARQPDPGPAKVLPRLSAPAVASIQLWPHGREWEMRVVRTNRTWQMVDPLQYPAQASGIEALLEKLEHLTAATYISETELKNRSNADEEYGFTTPQASIVLQPGDFRLRIGRTTAPGDQVFVQLGDVEGIYVVSSDLLALIPKKPNDWRDTTLLPWPNLTFDRLTVTNGATVFSLQRDRTNELWRIVSPYPLRANQAKVEDALQKLQALRVERFISDDPKTDLDPLGLQPPRLEIGVARDTNLLAVLQFGNAPTNEPKQVYARRFGQNHVVTVAEELLAPWRAPLNEFRDSHLVAFTDPVDSIEVRGPEAFTLQRQSTGGWCIVSNRLPIDAHLVQSLIDTISSLQVTEFVKEVVTDPDLPAYGLSKPWRQYTFKTAATNASGATTNLTIAELQFGATLENKVYARRADEPSVYAIKLADLQQLPSASWQLRALQIWNLSENEMAGVTVRQGGKTRGLIRNGLYKWSLAPGSQGIVDGFSQEETARGLCHLSASAWVALGETNRLRYGFTDDGHQVTLNLKNGEKRTVEFGGEAPSQFPYAAVRIDDQLWIFEFPLKLYHHVVGCFSIPSNAP